MPDNWSINALLEAMRQRGEALAVIALDEERETRLSYRQLAEEAESFAAGLIEAGAKPGDRGLLIGPNGGDWIIAFLGMAAAGFVVMPLDEQSSAEEIAAACAVAPPDWALCSPHHEDDLRAAAPDARLLLLSEAGERETQSWRDLVGPGRNASLTRANGDAPLLLLQTSGTTGAPKTFLLRTSHVAHNVLALAAAKLTGPGERILMPLPLHHAYPQVVGLLLPLHAGATVVLLATVTGPALLSALRKTEPTTLIGVPRLYEGLVGGLEREVEQRGQAAWAIYNALLVTSQWLLQRFGLRVGGLLFRPVRRQLSSSLRLLVSGGAKLSGRLTWRLAALGFDIRCGYGLAETASIATGNLPGGERLGSEGKPLGSTEIRIASADNEGIGEVQIRGPNVCAGYRDPEKTREAFTEDGWFQTGDLGRLDENGFLYVTGRIKETLVLGGGKKANPEELERIYTTSPFVAELAVLEREGALVALVRPDMTAFAEAGLTEIEQAIRVGLVEAGSSEPSYRRLAGFALTREPLPRTRLGKFRRFLLPELYRQAIEGTAPARKVARFEDSDLSQNAAATTAWSLLVERYGERLRGLEDHLALDLAIDSLEWIGLELDIAQRTGLNLEGINLAELTTVEDLLRRVAQASHAEPVSHQKAVDFWTSPAPLPWRLLGRALRGMNGIAIRNFFSLQVTGLEELPKSGPFVIVGNHTSYLDGFIIAATLPTGLWRRVRWSAARTQLLGLPRLSPFYRGLRIFPVAQGAPGEALAVARAALQSGEILVWFPEGWRSPDGKLQRFLPGIGLIVQGLECPIVPAHFTGAFEALPRGRRWPRATRITLRFGPPLRPQELVSRGAGQSDEERIAAALHDQVAALGGQAESETAA